MVNNSQRSLLTVAAAVFAVFCASNATADIILTGGTLTGVSPATVGTDGTAFGGTHSTIVSDVNFGTGQVYSTNFDDTTVSGSIGPAAIFVNAHAKTFYSAVVAGPQAQGFATGAIGFEVTQTGPATFTWSNLESILPRDSLQIKSADGSIVLGCVGTATFAGVTGGCEAGALPSANAPSNSLLQQGQVNLAIGAYSLFFSINSGHFVGTADDAAYAFSLTPTPLPAGLPLVLSGLATFWTFAFRRSWAPGSSRSSSGPLKRGL